MQNSRISFLPSFCLPSPPSAREALSRSVGRLETPAWIITSMTRSGGRNGKSERCVIPDRGIEARVPCGEGRATIEGGAQIVRRVVPIQDRAVGVPCERRSVADGVGQNDCARRGVSGVAESPDGLQVERAGHFEIKPKIAGLSIALNSRKVRRGRCSQPRLSGAHRRQATRRRRGCSVEAAATRRRRWRWRRRRTVNGIQSTIVSSGRPDLAVLACG